MGDCGVSTWIVGSFRMERFSDGLIASTILVSPKPRPWLRNCVPLESIQTRYNLLRSPAFLKDGTMEQIDIDLLHTVPPYHLQSLVKLRRPKGQTTITSALSSS